MFTNAHMTINVITKQNIENIFSIFCFVITLIVIPGNHPGHFSFVIL